MEFVPAATLWVLSIIRLPAALDGRRASVFRATVLAAAACTLYVPGVYYAVDPLLGGRNHVGLATLMFLLLGFWQFRTAILLAVVADDGRRRHQLLIGRVAVVVAGLVISFGFLESHVESTDQNFPLTYGNQPGMAVFLWCGSAFIIWVCFDIARVCRRNVPHMHSRTFRVAFLLIGLGCIAFCLVLIDRLLYGAVTRTSGTNGSEVQALNVFYSAGETLAVLLVSVGLLLPRIPTSLRQVRRGIQSRLLLFELQPAWRRLTVHRHYLVLEPRGTGTLILLSPHPEARLHRRLIEIRDCQMASTDASCSILPAEIALVERAERVLSQHR